MERAHIHDAPVPPPHHWAQCRFAGMIYPFEVGCEHIAPLRRFDLTERRIRNATSAIDQDIELPPALKRLRYQRFRRFAHTYIALLGHNCAGRTRYRERFGCVKTGMVAQ